MSSALITVAACSACIGVMPRSTIAQSSLAFSPCGIAGASVPHAIFTPLAIALPSIARARGNTSAALAWSSGAALDMSRPSER